MEEGEAAAAAAGPIPAESAAAAAAAAAMVEAVEDTGTVGMGLFTDRLMAE